MTMLHEGSKQIRETLALSGEERAAMRAHLSSLPSSVRMRTVRIPSPFYIHYAPAFSFALLLIVVTGGTSALAGGALPGDTLYAVKIHLNESVERTLATGAEAKAEVDIRHAEERLTEIELLAAEGETGEEAATKAAADVEVKIAAAAAAAAELADEGEAEAADGIHARIASTMRAHADILDAQAEDLDDEPKRQLRALSVAVSVAAKDADEGHEWNSWDDTDSYAFVRAENREKEAEARIKKLEQELDENHIPDETREELTAELSALTARFDEANELMAAELYADAGDAYEEVGSRAYRALALLSSAKRIGRETGKEVIIAIAGNDAPAEASDDESAAAASGPAMMKTMSFTIEATTTAERADEGKDEEEAEEDDERPLRFYLRDRDNDGDRGNSRGWNWGGWDKD